MLHATCKAARRFWLPLLTCAVLLGVLTVNAAAGTAAQLRPDMTIIIDGVEQTFYNAQGREVHPILCDGTTYLPVRAIGEVMGKNVDWNQTTKTVTLSGTRTAAATAGTPDSNAGVQDVSVDIRSDFTIVVDGKAQNFQDASGSRVYPMLYSGSTYLPLRAVGELMGKSVAWDGQTKTVTLTGAEDNLVTDADSFSGVAVPVKPDVPSAGLITVEDAKAAALEHAGLTADQVTFVKQKLERDNGRQVYDIEFYTSGQKEYDYEIDAATGAVLEFDYDADSYTPPASAGSITREQARDIALAKVPGASEGNVTKLKADRDDGRLVYEVEIKYNGLEYDFEISAADGTILEMDIDD